MTGPLDAPTPCPAALPADPSQCRSGAPVPGAARRAAVAVVGALLLALTTGCVSMPVEGPVVVADVPGRSTSDPGTAYQPSGPVPGASAQEVVLGFLEAMKAVPVRTTTALEFLTPQGRARWKPERTTITYAGLTAPDGESSVKLWAQEANSYDGVGRWEPGEDVDDQRLEFSLALMGGEWRIDRAPNALVVPQDWFATNFARAWLHQLAPSGATVVPELVHVPGGDQMATSLVKGLLAGVPEEDQEVLRSAVPPETTLAARSVPVNDTGVAEVALEGPDGALDDGVGAALGAQLLWTLRQVPGVQRVRVTWNSAPVSFDGAGAEVPVRGGDVFAPWGADATDALHGVVDGLLVTGMPEEAQPTTGVFGVQDQGVTAWSVSRDGTRVVAVVGDGTSLVQAPLRAQGVGQPPAPRPLLSGRGRLSAPTQDGRGRIWVLEQARGGARLLVLDGGRNRRVPLPTLEPGERVETMIVSADATRLVLLARGERGDRILMTRLVVDPDTGAVRTVGLRRLGNQLPTERRVLNLGWGPDGDVGVLSQLSADLSEIRLLSADGSPGEGMPPATFRVRPGSRGLALSPVPSTIPYVFAGTAVRDLRDPATVMPELPPGTTALFHAG